MIKGHAGSRGCVGRGGGTHSKINYKTLNETTYCFDKSAEHAQSQ